MSLLSRLSWDGWEGGWLETQAGWHSALVLLEVLVVAKLCNADMRVLNICWSACCAKIDEGMA